MKLDEQNENIQVSKSYVSQVCLTVFIIACSWNPVIFIQPRKIVLLSIVSMYTIAQQVTALF